MIPVNLAVPRPMEREKPMVNINCEVRVKEERVCVCLMS